MRNDNINTRNNSTRPGVSGNLYYVRLLTTVGPMYKIGFTTLGTVQQRFTFGTNIEQIKIDRVLRFVPMQDALEAEQLLHEYFKDQRAFSGEQINMPLYGNGQSELYFNDVLELDDDFTKEQAYQAKINARRLINESEESFKIWLAGFNNMQKERPAISLSKPINYIISLYCAAYQFLFIPRLEVQNKIRAKAIIEWLRRMS